MPQSAPGIPNRKNVGNMTTLPTDALLTLIRQRHDAKRSHLHEDLRIGTPAGLYSFAVPKFLPEKSGEKRLAITQPLHKWNWKDFEGEIPAGQYGAGSVSKMEESPVILLKNTPNHVMFTRGNKKNAPIYDMIATKGGNWIVSIKKEGEPPIVQTWKKEHFKSVPMSQVPDLIDAGAAVSSKIDGAGILAYLGKHGIEAYGIRPDKYGKHPNYTDVIGGLRSFRVPEELQGQLIRGELYGTQGGKVIHPNQLGAILNSTLANAVDRKQKTGTNLLIAALALNRNGVDDYTADLSGITKKLKHPAIHSLPMYRGDAAKKLVAAMQAGKYPLTREGVVIHQPGKRPLKSKFIDDYDVVIRDIFPADTKGTPRAGGFTYSYPGSNKVIGRVGTGFDRVMATDMLMHPEKYVGRTARVHSQEQLPSTALRAPGFIAMKED